VKPPVLLTRRIPASVLSRLQAACSVDLHEGDDPIPRAELLARVRGQQALLCLLTDRVDVEVLDAGADLRIVANIAVGYDNIDVASAHARALPVTNTPDVLTGATAEFTWALILAVTRRVAEGERLLRGGTWKGWALDFMLGMELRGKQLGIVGLGRIGSAVAARAPAFGMRVAACTLDTPGPGPGRTSQAASREPDVEMMTLDRLLATSDVVTLHVPMTPETRHLIGRAALSRMKPSSYLVNTSRGPVVDEGALAWALGARLIAGAALDVYEQEPRVHAGLLGLDHVVLAPHLGSATTETRTAMASLAVDNVLAVLSGREPLTPVAG
jgi:glyoxylate reductase